ncbi:hypothetical protein [Arcobacter vandammei]|uniref:hypothetical protein n=1 Tax=Arcobacter vandammei TaxID=2782243 RepID=UPI0018E0113B|nr:hypothetical protein [Arcobacter vandammei]
MSSELLRKLQKAQKNIKKDRKENLNINSSFGTLTDEEIALVLSLRAKELRISQNKKQVEFSNEANLSSPTTYSNFEQKGNISILNFIKVIRNFGRLDELEKLLLPTPKEMIEKFEKSDKKRVR